MLIIGANYCHLQPKALSIFCVSDMFAGLAQLVSFSVREVLKFNFWSVMNAIRLPVRKWC